MSSTREIYEHSRKRREKPLKWWKIAIYCVLLVAVLKGLAMAKAISCFREGLIQKANGWPEESRSSMRLAAILDWGGSVGQEAEDFIKTRLPRYATAKEASMKNIDAFNMWSRGEVDEAEKIFLELISEHPRFEWPYGNLGALYVEAGKLDKAFPLLEKAVEINPWYINGWVHLSTARFLKNDIDGGIDALRRAKELDPAGMATQELEWQLKLYSEGKLKSPVVPMTGGAQR